MLQDIRRFLLQHNMTNSKFGRLALNDPRLVFDLAERDRKLRPGTEQRVREFMRTYRP